VYYPVLVVFSPVPFRFQTHASATNLGLLSSAHHPYHRRHQPSRQTAILATMVMNHLTPATQSQQIRPKTNPNCSRNAAPSSSSSPKVTFPRLSSAFVVHHRWHRCPRPGLLDRKLVDATGRLNLVAFVAYQPAWILYPVAFSGGSWVFYSSKFMFWLAFGELQIKRGRDLLFHVLLVKDVER